MHLPHPIAAYFEADRDLAGPAPVQLFAPNAAVTDEGRTHIGPDAIGAWWRNAKAAYRHTAEPLAIIERDGVTEVRARVTGQFPGSPAVLTFVFGLADDRITSLKIGL